jgi:N-acetylmuramoyl-L-alanine amidase
MGDSFTRPGIQRASATVNAALVLICTVGCGQEPPARPDGSGPAAAPIRLPDDDAAFALPLAELEAKAEEAGRAAARVEATAEGVRLRREHARLARILALRGAEGDWIGQARTSLREASRRSALAGACDAALELARLEARDERDLTAAYAAAYRTARRFAGRREAEACAGEARRMTEVLAAHRPGPEVLAAIDADPDADDPSAGMEPPAAPADPIAALVAERAAEGAALLERIAVYGQPAPGAAPAAGGLVRVVLHLDRAAVFERGEIPADGELPRRAFLDFERTRPAPGVAPSTQVGAGGVRRVRVGSPRPRRLRVVFDLDEDARYRLFFLTDPYRVVLDFERTGRPVVEVAAPAEGRLRTVVLDPGHGGNDYGARYEGLHESQIALDITRRVATLLEQRLPEARILMTRNRDELVDLEQRTAFANSVAADIFVSIHLNAADDPVEHGGVTTFVLDTSNDRQANRLAARENNTTAAEVTGLERILAHLHRAEQVGESRRLAAEIQRFTLLSGRRLMPHLPDRGVKSAMFYVLVGARMPAVLVEASFLTQPEEAALLRTERYRQALADGIAEGIVRYGRAETPSTP